MSNYKPVPDWSKAPEGATHWGPDTDNYHAAWYREKDGEWEFWLCHDDCSWDYAGTVSDRILIPRPDTTITREEVSQECKVRAEFEEWAVPEGYARDRMVSGHYIHAVTSAAWHAWQAASRAAPDVNQLVEALEYVAFYHEEVGDNDGNLMMHYSKMMRKVKEALSAHRKQGGGA